MPWYVDPAGGLVRLDQGLQAEQPTYVHPAGGLIKTLQRQPIFSAVVESGDAGGSSSAQETADFTPDADSTYIAFHCARESGNNGTATQLDSITDNHGDTGGGNWVIHERSSRADSNPRDFTTAVATKRYGSTPGSGRLTFNTNHSCVDHGWQVFKLIPRSAGNVFNVVQTKADDNASSSFTLSMDSVPVSTNLLVAQVYSRSESDGLAGDADGTELFDMVVDSTHGFMAQFFEADGPQDIDFSSLGGSANVYIGIEFEEAADSGPTLKSDTDSGTGTSAESELVHVPIVETDTGTSASTETEARDKAITLSDATTGASADTVDSIAATTSESDSTTGTSSELETLLARLTQLDQNIGVSSDVIDGLPGTLTDTDQGTGSTSTEQETVNSGSLEPKSDSDQNTGIGAELQTVIVVVVEADTTTGSATETETRDKAITLADLSIGTENEMSSITVRLGDTDSTTGLSTEDSTFGGGGTVMDADATTGVGSETESKVVKLTDSDINLGAGNEVVAIVGTMSDTDLNAANRSIELQIVIDPAAPVEDPESGIRPLWLDNAFEIGEEHT